MSTSRKTVGINAPGSRRQFLQSAGLLAVAGSTAVARPPLPTEQTAQWWRGSGMLNLLAEGWVEPMAGVTPPWVPWVLPPLLDPLPINPELEGVRMHVAYPASQSRSVVGIQIFVAAYGAPMPTEGPIPFTPLFLLDENGQLVLDENGMPVRNPPPCTIAYIEMWPTDVQISRHPMLNIGLLGRVISNPFISPYGDLTGYTMALTAGVTMEADGTATFSQLAGHLAGSHTTMARMAVGTFSCMR